MIETVLVQLSVASGFELVSVSDEDSDATNQSFVDGDEVRYKASDLIRAWILIVPPIVTTQTFGCFSRGLRKQQ